MNVRILSATNRDIRQMVAENLFRQDLFYRLSVLPIELPPLRERRDDIPLLVRYFFRLESLKSGMKEKRVKPDAMQKLISWSWPGNIRELQNLVRYLVVVTDSEYIDSELLPVHFFQSVMPEPLSHLPAIRAEGVAETGNRSAANKKNGVIFNNDRDEDLRYGVNFGNQTWDELEENYIRFVLKKNNWNVTWAAKVAGLNRSTFASRMRRLGIRKSDLHQTN